MFHCYGHGGTCRLTAAPMSGSTAPATSMAATGTAPRVTLSAPIGQGHSARNLFPDVIAVQRGLNALLPGDRGFLKPLVEDGLCGPKTRAAIQLFQILHFGWKGADGLMEPARQTVNKLNELLKTKAYVAPTLEDIARAMGLSLAQLEGALQESFALAKEWIRAGYHRTLNPLADPLLEKYFQLDRQRDPAGARRQVGLIFGRLNTFFLRPGGLWGEAAFQPEPRLRATSTYAWCSAGGYFMPGQTGFVPMDEKETLYPIRFDTIYYTLRFIFMSVEARAYCIVHELCHYVAQDPEIRDKVYAHKDPEGFASLPPPLRMINTDHYAMMAFEAATGRSVSPVPPE